MSDEVELTPEIASQLFAPKPLPTSEPEGQAEPSKPADPTTPPEAQAPATSTAPPELSPEQAELARRYGLSPENVRRVRGETWAEKCEDAERLAALAKPGVNEGEIAALAAHGQKESQREAWWLGGGGEAP